MVAFNSISAPEYSFYRGGVGNILEIALDESEDLDDRVLAMVSPDVRALRVYAKTPHCPAGRPSTRPVKLACTYAEATMRLERLKYMSFMCVLDCGTNPPALGALLDACPRLDFLQICGTHVPPDGEFHVFPTERLGRLKCLVLNGYGAVHGFDAVAARVEAHGGRVVRFL